MKQWIFIALSLTIAIGGCGSFSQQQKDQKLKNANSRFHWQSMVDGDESDWADLTLEQLQNFIAAGVNINATNNDGFTSLHHASFHNESIEVIMELIKAGADIHAKGILGHTPLHAAASNNSNARIIKELIKAGADVDARVTNGYTPLHTAAFWNGSIEIIRELINTGADVDAKTYNGYTPCDVLESNAELKNNSEAWEKAQELLCR